jgi:rSAM/selenodomain-associated transferase 1
MHRPTRIVIFAKAPIPGFCKTRLIGALGEEGAAALAAKMLCRTVEIAMRADMGPVELCVAPEPEHPSLRALDLVSEVAWSRQAEGDLGARMASAVLRTLARDENVLCIGTDCLELEVKHLQEAARALRQNPVVIAPALDGGYVLLGLSQFDASIFQDMVWSTDRVFQETMHRVERLGWHVTQMETLRDIDEPGDLAFLPVKFK